MDLQPFLVNFDFSMVIGHLLVFFKGVHVSHVTQTRLKVSDHVSKYWSQQHYEKYTCFWLK